MPGGYWENGRTNFANDVCNSCTLDQCKASCDGISACVGFDTSVSGTDSGTCWLKSSISVASADYRSNNGGTRTTYFNEDRSSDYTTGCTAPAPTSAPTSAPAGVTYNDVRQTNVGGIWSDAGGSCTCPSGSVYTVGWDWNTKGLACIGGTAGPCNGYRPDGNGCNDLASDGAKVTCDTSASSRAA